MADSDIEWTDKVWNPVTGCTKVSSGCKNCYAERMSKRHKGRFGYPADDPFRVTLHEDRLKEPLRWRKPKRIFVCSMGDLFHEDVASEDIVSIFKVMAISIENGRSHTFMVLTKRPKRLAEFVKACPQLLARIRENVWFGVSVEDQKTADERIPLLLQTPAAKRFVSYEPALGPVDLKWHLTEPTGNFRTNPITGKRQMECKGHGLIDWIVCGGESGPGARPMHPDWARSVRDQCEAAGVPFMFKQWGEWAPTIEAEYLNTESRKLELHETALKEGYPHKTITFVDKTGRNRRIRVEDGMFRVGKKAAGHLLDGKEHMEVGK